MSAWSSVEIYNADFFGVFRWRWMMLGWWLDDWMEVGWVVGSRVWVCGALGNVLVSGYGYYR
jgi:hypothetical protein